MFECYLHHYKTEDIEAWDRHCYYTGHTLTVWQNGEEVEEPYPRHHMRDNMRKNTMLTLTFEDDELK